MTYHLPTLRAQLGAEILVRVDGVLLRPRRSLRRRSPRRQRRPPRASRCRGRRRRSRRPRGRWRRRARRAARSDRPRRRRSRRPPRGWRCARRSRRSPPPARGRCPPGPRPLRRTALLPVARSTSRRSCSLMLLSSLIAAWVGDGSAAQPANDPSPNTQATPQPNSVVQAVHDRHHDDDEHQHDAGVAEQLAPGRGDDLPQLGEDLTDEESDPCERAAPFCALPLGTRDEVLAGLVDNLACHSLTTVSADSIPRRMSGDSQGGQDSNLQPAVLETAALPIEPPPYRTGSHGSAPANERVDPEMGTAKLGGFQPPRLSVRHSLRSGTGVDPRSGGGNRTESAPS